MGCGSSKGRQGIIKPYEYVTMQTFRCKKVIGKGGFGKVCIVERKQDRALFALKYTEKKKASKDRALHYILQERNILEDVHHPYICAMRYSFQDSKFLYMVLDLMEGGDLRFHLKNMKRVPENTTLFIVSEISSALEYLHSLNIVHRDIKPDNILLDKSGHAHLSDFNVAVQYIVGKPLKSIAGTEPYMAPEMLNGQGYFGAVDWWSLGVTMFELIYGERPFRSKHRRELIKKGKWRFPPDAKDVSEACMLALTDFLRFDPSRRLGYGFAGSGLDSLRVHPFFGKMDWDGLASRLAPPPFVPTVAQPSSNFACDASSDELVMYLKQMKAIGAVGPGSTSLSTGFQDPMADIVPEFLYYDYTVIDPNVYRPSVLSSDQPQRGYEEQTVSPQTTTTQMGGTGSPPGPGSMSSHINPYTAGVERINTNFETNNASFASFAFSTSMFGRANTRTSSVKGGRQHSRIDASSVMSGGGHGLGTSGGTTSGGGAGGGAGPGMPSSPNVSAMLSQPLVFGSSAGVGASNSGFGGGIGSNGGLGGPGGLGSDGTDMAGMRSRKRAASLSVPKGEHGIVFLMAGVMPGSSHASGVGIDVAAGGASGTVGTNPSGASQASITPSNVSLGLQEALNRHNSHTVGRRHTFNGPQRKQRQQQQQQQQQQQAQQPQQQQYRAGLTANGGGSSYMGGGMGSSRLAGAESSGHHHNYRRQNSSNINASRDNDADQTVDAQSGTPGHRGSIVMSNASVGISSLTSSSSVLAAQQGMHRPYSHQMIAHGQHRSSGMIRELRVSNADVTPRTGSTGLGVMAGSSGPVSPGAVGMPASPGSSDRYGAQGQQRPGQLPGLLANVGAVALVSGTSGIGQAAGGNAGGSAAGGPTAKRRTGDEPPQHAGQRFGSTNARRASLAAQEREVSGAAA